MRIIFIIIAAAVLAAISYFTFYRPTPPPQIQTALSNMAERVQLKTQDNVSIVGDYYAPVSPSAKGLLLLHMMPAVRSSWRAFAEKNTPAGWRVLAIDLRGHGESQGGPPEASLAKGGPNGYKSFSDEEHQASKLDVEAGAEFLQSKGVTELYLGGASIGANLSLQYLSEHPEAKAAFLLSPGLDYKGIKTESLAQSLKSDQAVYYVASSQDAYSAESAKKLFDQTAVGAKKEIKIFDNAGHGTTIFEKEPQFMDVIAAWLQEL